MLILGVIVFGMAIGALAQLLLGRRSRQIDWAMAMIAGLVGSFVGGLLFSLLAGDGLAFRASGVIGSLIGALIITAIWQATRRRAAPAPPAQRRRPQPGRR